jgi:hypothetical protein
VSSSKAEAQAGDAIEPSGNLALNNENEEKQAVGHLKF